MFRSGYLEVSGSFSLKVMSCCLPLLKEMTRKLTETMSDSTRLAMKKQDSVLAGMMILCLSCSSSTFSEVRLLMLRERNMRIL